MQGRIKQRAGAVEGELPFHANVQFATAILHPRGFRRGDTFRQIAEARLIRGGAKSRNARSLTGMKRLGGYTKLTGSGGG